MFVYLDDFLQHCLGNVYEEERVSVVGGHTHKLVAVVVGRQHVHAGVPQLEKYASIGPRPGHVTRYHHVVPGEGARMSRFRLSFS